MFDCDIAPCLCHNLKFIFSLHQRVCKGIVTLECSLSAMFNCNIHLLIIYYLWKLGTLVNCYVTFSFDVSLIFILITRNTCWIGTLRNYEIYHNVRLRHCSTVISNSKDWSLKCSSKPLLDCHINFVLKIIP